MKAFCFDVFGTVVDWRTGVAREASEFFSRHQLAGIDPYDFADAWRNLYQPAMEACRSGKRPFTRLDILHRENLEIVLRKYDVNPDKLDDDALAQLNSAWHRLDPWPDVVTGLTQLKRNHIIAPASNGNIALMVNMAKRAGIPWDAILGAEVTQAYKPSPPAYTRMVEILGFEPQEVCMVAAHNNDLHAARQCGLATAFVARKSEHGVHQTTDLEPSEDWDFVVRDFNELADRVLSSN
ncbi:haloacid dehalogenase type II [Pollutimonas harenae]|uniref:Haloacid dehalogenase type II n=1 Tax=Pollutimonas harenae TaxID=657015 RepID=A0A853H6N0_9BURK|nr:haloacid dehalogenase type II [Pollutimonas harenae]NYT86173.1 haloacid dehalogenase type II [Pollutimonas harenae]TEA71208.1 haloacid dehalogenase type II [Pollutimonas harenae]